MGGSVRRFGRLRTRQLGYCLLCPAPGPSARSKSSRSATRNSGKTLPPSSTPSGPISSTASTAVYARAVRVGGSIYQTSRCAVSKILAQLAFHFAWRVGLRKDFDSQVRGDERRRLVRDALLRQTLPAYKRDVWNAELVFPEPQHAVCAVHAAQSRRIEVGFDEIDEHGGKPAFEVTHGLLHQHAIHESRRSPPSAPWP